MSSFTRRTLRTWAVVAGAHGALLAVVAALLVPWKTPWVNVIALLYAALQVAVAVGLWQRARWGWRLGLAAGLLGLGAGVLVITGLLSSWLYLKSVYGVFGYGAALVCLLFGAVAFQLLGLVPALQLRALLRREVRADLGPAKTARFILFGMLMVPLVAAPLAYAPFRLAPVAPVPGPARQQTIEVLRAALERRPLPSAPALASVPLGPGPLYVTIWSRGRALVRVTGSGATLAAAIDQAATALQDNRDLAGRALSTARIKVDRVAAVGPLLAEWSPVVALSVVPGADGLRRRGAPPGRVLLPDDMVRNARFGLAPLLPRLREVRLGLDALWALERLGADGGPLERFSVESWVEFEGGTEPVTYGGTPLEPGSAASYREAALSGGAYLLRQLKKDGRFVYKYRPLDDRAQGTSAASLARHAGAVYALSQLFHHTKQRRFARGAKRSAAWLIGQRRQRCGQHSCIGEGHSIKLGGSALTLISLLEYQRSVGSDRFERQARSLADFVLTMQREDGEFHHRYWRLRSEPDPTARSMFASEQSALALLMAHEVLGDERYLDAAERALDYLTGPKYDYFLGWFSFGADHWTCIAAEEAWPRLKKPRYLDFCRGYASFIGRMQFGAEVPAWAGHYGFSALMVPQAPATAGFTEAVVSTYVLAQHHGQDVPILQRQMSAALDALRRDQLRPENSYLVAKPQAAAGGIRRSLVEEEIRIDFVQHAVSALIRAPQL